MHPAQKQVQDFHEALGVTVGNSPEIRDAELRASLILEEAVETASALVGSKRALEMLEKTHGKVQDSIGRPGDAGSAPNLVEVIDGVCDILYVTYGTAVACGFDVEPFYDEVHASNMSKASGPRRADGKILKPEGWQPPRIAEILAKVSK